MSLSLVKKLTVFFLVILANFILRGQALAQTTPTPTPVGQVISLDFKIPGIGSEGGNLKPLHNTRNVTLYFFDPNINSSDLSSKPVASFNTQVVYDSDQNSPTFGSFVNSDIDLGDAVSDGQYQIVFKTSQALSKLVKEKDKDIGGKVFDIKKSLGQAIVITNQVVIIGDIYPSPSGDNVIDINDYDSLINCFGSKADSTSCNDKIASDLNDDGVVNGADYNLLLSSIKTLSSLGLPVPQLLVGTPAITPKPITNNPIKTNPSIKKEVKAKASTIKNPFTIFLFLLSFFALIVTLVILFLKRNKLKKPLDANSAEDQIKTKEDAKEEVIDKEYFVKKQTVDNESKTIVLTLTDDKGPTLGYYKGKEVPDGFSKVKGVMKRDGNKVFIDVSEIIPGESTEATS